MILAYLCFPLVIPFLRTMKIPKNLSGSLKWIILLIVFACYLPALKNQFLLWDDKSYIIENQVVKKISLENTVDYFTHSYVNTYVPVTMLVWNIEYQFYGEKPLGYILLNILLHLCNTLLVYFLVRQWFKNEFVALICMALFGLHPIHVESVAWITERKDVLYTFFFFLSLYQYGKFREATSADGFSREAWRQKNFLFSVLFFFLSLLSKGQAVVLPLILILLDYFEKRKLFSKQQLIEKGPLFLLSVIFGSLAIWFQRSSYGGGWHTYVFGIYDKILLSSFAFVQYILNLLVPLKLSAGYPLPVPGRPLPAEFPFMLILFLLFISGMIFLLWKRNRFGFALAFFFINLILVLDHSSVGKLLMADRFVYVASLGLFLCLAFGLDKLKTDLPAGKYLVYLLIIPYLFLLSMTCYSRCKVWKNEETLFLDALKKYPYNPVICNEIGAYYLHQKEYETALHYYLRGVQQYPGYSDIIINRGLCYYYLDSLPQSMRDITRGLWMNPSVCEGWQYRGRTRIKMKDYTGAVHDFNNPIKLSKGKFAVAYLNRASAYLRMDSLEPALCDCEYYIHKYPENPGGYYTRAQVRERMKNLAGAQSDYEKAVKLDPEDTDFLYALAGFRSETLHDMNGSFEVLLQVVAIDPKHYQAWNDLGVIYYMRGDIQAAIESFTRSIRYSKTYLQPRLNRGMLYMNLGQAEQAKEDISEAKRLGAIIPEEVRTRLGL